MSLQTLLYMPSKLSLQALLSTPSSVVWSGTRLNLQSSYHPRSFLSYPLQSISRIGSTDDGFRSLSQVSSSTSTGFMDEAREQKSKSVKRKIEGLGICPDSCTPGSFDLFYCPKCRGGKSIQRSLSFHISQNWNYAMWRCFHLECGLAGQILADTEDSDAGPSLHGKNNSAHTLTMDSLRLEMLGDELLAYFAGRNISKETLQRNNVMQVAGDEKIIAFTYWHNGLLVGCKYRNLKKKRFWQEKNTEKWLYGLDDIAEADEIIIVEGEIDKLSLEEAGYYNCVSVPGGAPQVVSRKELPSPDQDRGFRYLWNCKDYLDKASRIVLATDDDVPGRALSEELARRLGIERCLRVQWPKRDESSRFKDASEVLEYLGAEALRDAIDNAELTS